MLGLLFNKVKKLEATSAEIAQQKGTIATPTFNADGTLQKKVYTDKQGNTVRTDTYTYGLNTVTEVTQIGGSTRTTVVNTNTSVMEVN